MAAAGWCAQGTPEDVQAACPTSHTGVALREYDRAMGAACRRRRKAFRAPQGAERARARRRSKANVVRIVNAREHNLKSAVVDIPRGKFNVMTGVSGSGKSTLAFDILFNEGQRRYLESLNAYARSIVQPAGGPRSTRCTAFRRPSRSSSACRAAAASRTVATTTEVWHFLRLLYVKLGHAALHTTAPVMPQSPKVSRRSC
jgi:excinuclease ABC subunit A